MTDRGFTLIELLVAVALFALVSVMAYTGLQSVLSTGAAAGAAAERLAALQRAMTFIVTDFAQAAPRGARDALGDPVPAMRTDVGRVLFTRAGMPSARQSTLIRVGYGPGSDGALVRYRWPVLDRALQLPPAETVMLTGVRAVRFRFLHDGEWLGSWPPVVPSGDPPALPPAVMVELELADYGEIRRLIRLPGAS